jgi:hypothetical protein
LSHKAASSHWARSHPEDGGGRSGESASSRRALYAAMVADGSSGARGGVPPHAASTATASAAGAARHAFDVIDRNARLDCRTGQYPPATQYRTAAQRSQSQPAAAARACA